MHAFENSNNNNNNVQTIQFQTPFNFIFTDLIFGSFFFILNKFFNYNEIIKLLEFFSALVKIRFFFFSGN